MDIYALVAANLPAKARPSRIGARAEESYFASQVDMPRLGVWNLGSIAIALAGILLVIGI